MGNERIQRVDPETGTAILQLTSFPVIHWLMGPTSDSISPSGDVLLLQSNDGPCRDAGRDLWRVRSDGADLMPLGKGLSGGIVTTDGRHAVAGRAGTRRGELARIPLYGGPEEVIAELDCVGAPHASARTPDGRYALGAARAESGVFSILRCDLRSGEVLTLCHATYIMPVQVHGANGDRVTASIAPSNARGESVRPWGYWAFDVSAPDTAWQAVPFSRSTNHYAVRGGGSDEVVTTTEDPSNALDIAGAGADSSRELCRGAGFWHVTCDATGEWAVADTNWPDIGLQLVHIPSGRFATLCHTGASGGHPQWTHAHPCLAPDASYVLFTSDRTGIQQVYRAEIAEDVKARLR